MGGLLGFACTVRLLDLGHGKGGAQCEAPAGFRTAITARQGVGAEPLGIADAETVIHEVPNGGREGHGERLGSVRDGGHGICSRQERGLCADGPD